MLFSLSPLGFSLHAVRFILTCNKMEGKVFSSFSSFCLFFSQHTVQWNDERKAGTSKIHFQGGFYQSQIPVPCYWLYMRNFYFPVWLGTQYQNSLLSTDGRCLLLVHGQRKKEIVSPLGLWCGHFPNQSFADGVLCPLIKTVTWWGQRRGGHSLFLWFIKR